MITLQLVPLSVNKCWMGRRFKTKVYKDFEDIMLGNDKKKITRALPDICLPPAPYCLKFIFGLSNVMSDVDNPVKPFVDILQKRYGFNDCHVIAMSSYKQKVDKGSEFIKFEIFTADKDLQTMLNYKHSRYNTKQ